MYVLVKNYSKITFGCYQNLNNQSESENGQKKNILIDHHNLWHKEVLKTGKGCCRNSIKGQCAVRRPMLNKLPINISFISGHNQCRTDRADQLTLSIERREDSEEISLSSHRTTGSKTPGSHSMRPPGVWCGRHPDRKQTWTISQEEGRGQGAVAPVYRCCLRVTWGLHWESCCFSPLITHRAF